MACTLTLPTIVMPSSPRNSQGAGAAASPLLRSVPVGRDPVALAVDARTGRVFVVGAAGSVTTLDAATGRFLRSVAVGRGAQAVAVDEATGRVFVTDPGRAFMLDARSGAILRALSLGGGPTGGLAVDVRHGEVFVPANGAPRPVEQGGGFGPGGFAVLDAATGRLRRRLRQYGDPFALDGAARRLILPYSCGDTPGVADLCVDTLDAVTGRRIKTADLSSQNGYPQGPSAVAVDARAGRAFVLYGDGCGDVNIGTLATRTGVGQGLVGGAEGNSGTMAVDEGAGRIAIATTLDDYMPNSNLGPPWAGALVSVLDTRSGRGLASTTIPTTSLEYLYRPVAVADPQRGRFYVAATLYPSATVGPRSILDVFAASSGRLVRTLPFPAAAAQLFDAPTGPTMAVDGRTSRLFIANAGANTVSVLDTARL